LDGRGFFYQSGLGAGSSADSLIDYAYSAAYFWRLDPFEVMNRPLSDLVEMTRQAHRLHKEMRE
jgi:hypothetical protein